MTSTREPGRLCPGSRDPCPPYSRNRPSSTRPALTDDRPAFHDDGMNIQTIRYGQTSTPFGTVLVARSEVGIVALSIHSKSTWKHEVTALHRLYPGAEFVEDASVAVAVAEPWGRGNFTPCGKLDPAGTPFQKRVWRTLQTIPPGETWSYEHLAEHIGTPRAVRAVASACGRNPVAVLVPCHRVVRKDGGLGGYRWGLDVKRKLLALEQV